MLPLFQKNSHSFGKQQIIRQIRTLSRITKNKEMYAWPVTADNGAKGTWNHNGG